MRPQDPPRDRSVVATFRSYATVVGVSAVASLVSFATTILLARHLTTTQFGYFSIFFAAMTVLWTATNFGDSAYIRFVNARATDDPAPYLRALLVIEVMAIALLAAASWPVAHLLAGALGGSHYFVPLLTGILLGLGMNFVSLWGATFQAEGKYFRFSTLRAVVNVLVLAGVAGTLAVTTLTLQLVYVVYAVAVGTMAGLSIGVVYRRCRPLRVDVSLVRTLMRFSRWLIASNFTYILTQRLDIVVVAAVTSPATVGQYGAALRIAVVASLLTGSITPLMLPKASRVEPTRESLVGFLRHVAKFTGVLIALIAAIWLSLPLWVPLLLGSRYEDSVTIARILLLASGCLAAYTPLSQLFVADENPRRVFLLNVTRLLVLATLLSLLAPRYGGAGGAWGIVGAELASLLYTLIAVRRQILRSKPAVVTASRAR